MTAPNDFFTRRVLPLILRYEGGYVDHPSDPGGETKYGISKRSYPDLDIQHLTIEDAGEIYYRDYWQVCRCDDLPRALALSVFDSAVNQGTHAAIKLLQDAVAVDTDGILGSVTLEAARHGTLGNHLASFTTARILRYTNTRNFDVFGRGWVARAIHVYGVSRQEV